MGVDASLIVDERIVLWFTWIDFTARWQRRFDSGGDGKAKTLSIDAVHVHVDNFNQNDRQFHRGGDNTATTLSFDAGQDDDEYTAKTLGVNVCHKCGGRKG